MVSCVFVDRFCQLERNHENQIRTVYAPTKKRAAEIGDPESDPMRIISVKAS